jgi:prolyl-tRNA synthetase
MLVSPAALKKEEDELHGFEAEVAWVTKSGKTELAIPVAIRPTSETIMYPAFKNWINSHRDLPLKVNQWCNVVRWEFKHPVPFIRTREFLWQEGHTAHATLEEAEKEVYYILDCYASAYQDLLAVPVIRGKKSDKEKFAGAIYTTTVEAYIPSNGRAVQAATSHCLGQTFAKMFEVEYLSEDGSKQLVWQNSWGFTTRSIGIMIMIHGDDKGLVLPPRVASYQAVIIPITMKKTNVEEMTSRANDLCAALKAKGVRAIVDNGVHNPGWKFNHWEKLGVPLRLELGPKDMESKTVVMVRRDTGDKETVSWETLPETAETRLEDIQKNLLARATEKRDQSIIDVATWEDFVPALSKKCICRVPWCNTTECEEKIKECSAKESLSLTDEEVNSGLTGSAKSLCMPFEQRELPTGTKCFACGKEAKVECLFGRSY